MQLGVDNIKPRITDSYAMGEVSGDEYLGGITGLHGLVNIKATYWDAENSGQSKGAGGGDVSGANGLITSVMSHLK